MCSGDVFYAVFLGLDTNSGVYKTGDVVTASYEVLLDMFIGRMLLA